MPIERGVDGLWRVPHRDNRCVVHDGVKCTRYQQRPFLCKVYPLVLIRRGILRRTVVGLSVTCPWVRGLQEKLAQGKRIDNEMAMILSLVPWMRKNAPAEIVKVWTLDAKKHALLLFVNQ
jgi:hypothetical protein